MHCICLHFRKELHGSLITCFWHTTLTFPHLSRTWNLCFIKFTLEGDLCRRRWRAKFVLKGRQKFSESYPTDYLPPSAQGQWYCPGSQSPHRLGSEKHSEPALLPVLSACIQIQGQSTDGVGKKQIHFPGPESVRKEINRPWKFSNSPFLAWIILYK